MASNISPTLYSLYLAFWLSLSIFNIEIYRLAQKLIFFRKHPRTPESKASALKQLESMLYWRSHILSIALCFCQPALAKAIYDEGRSGLSLCQILLWLFIANSVLSRLRIALTFTHIGYLRRGPREKWDRAYTQIEPFTHGRAYTWFCILGVCNYVTSYVLYANDKGYTILEIGQNFTYFVALGSIAAVLVCAWRMAMVWSDLAKRDEEGVHLVEAFFLLMVALSVLDYLVT